MLRLHYQEMIFSGFCRKYETRVDVGGGTAWIWNIESGPFSYIDIFQLICQV